MNWLNRNLRMWLGVYLRGAAIGTADLIPGVSGGTIAFITGIYERLLTAIKVGSSPTIWLFVLRGQWKIFWKAADCSFLLVLLLGVLSAVLLMSNLLHELLVTQTSALLGFFAGLVVAATVLVLRQIMPFKAHYYVCLLTGFAAALAVSLSQPVEQLADPSLAVFFFAGMLALCAMILPGISGSFILLLIGVYPHLIESLHLREFDVVVVFAAGGILGLALFARVLKRLLVSWHNETVAVMVGVMVGSLPKLWPWKESAEGIKVMLQPSIWPTDAADPGYALVASCVVAGIACVWATEYTARRLG